MRGSSPRGTSCGHRCKRPGNRRVRRRQDAIAFYIHSVGPVEPVVCEIDCGTLPTSLLEAELFGYERGAFTGASSPAAWKRRIENAGARRDRASVNRIANQLLRVIGRGLNDSVGARRSRSMRD